MNIKGALWLLGNADKLAGRKIDIFSDSQACIKALAKNTTNCKIIAECKSLIFEVNLRLNTTVTLYWVKGHNNNTGNELADYLAKTGAQLSPFGPLPFIPLSLNTVKNNINDSYVDKWQKLWSNLPSCRQTKLFTPFITPSLAK